MYYNSSNRDVIWDWMKAQAPIGGVYVDNGTPIDSFHVETQDDGSKKKVWPNAKLRQGFFTEPEAEELRERLADGLGDKFGGLEEGDFYNTKVDLLKRKFLYALIDGQRIPLQAFRRMVWAGEDLQQRALFDEKEYVLGVGAPTKIRWDDEEGPLPVAVRK